MYYPADLGVSALHCGSESIGEYGSGLFHQGTWYALLGGIPIGQVQTQNSKSPSIQIHPNDGFIRQLKHYSETLKAQQRNARRTREEVSPNRSIEKSISIEKQREVGNTSGYLDKTMADFKSIELIPHRETTPQRTAIDRRGELY